MKKDQEPSLSNISLPDDDKDSNVRKTGARSRARTSTKTSAVALETPKQTLAIIALVAALLLGALAVYLFMRVQALHEHINSADKIIAIQAQGYESLNEKLSVADENATMTIEELRTLIKEHDSEIRKLWTLANKKNRGEIVANTKNIGELKTSLAKTNATTEQHQKQIKAAADIDVATDKRVSKVETRLTGLAEAELRLAQQADLIASLTSEVNALKRSTVPNDVAKLRLQVDDLNMRLSNLQAAAAKAQTTQVAYAQEQALTANTMTMPANPVVAPAVSADASANSYTPAFLNTTSPSN